MYNVKLKRGLIVPIYTDYKNDSGYQGMGELIEFHSEGESFYEDYEVLKYTSNDQSSLVKKLNKRQKRSNAIWERIKEYSEMKNPDIKSFFVELKKRANSRKLNSYNSAYKYVEVVREKYNNKTSALNGLLTYADTRTLVRFVQQTTIKNWTPTIFSSERWLVRILPQDKYSSTFTTFRYIKCVKCISPKEDINRELAKHTTYNGEPSKKIRKMISVDSDDFEKEPTDEEIFLIESSLKLVN